MAGAAVGCAHATEMAPKVMSRLQTPGSRGRKSGRSIRTVGVEGEQNERTSRLACCRNNDAKSRWPTNGDIKVRVPVNFFQTKFRFARLPCSFAPATSLPCPHQPRFSSASPAPWQPPPPAALRVGCARRIIICTGTIPLFRGITHAYCPVGRTTPVPRPPQPGGPGSVLPLPNTAELAPSNFPALLELEARIKAPPYHSSFLILHS